MLARADSSSRTMRRHSTDSPLSSFPMLVASSLCSSWKAPPWHWRHENFGSLWPIGCGLHASGLYHGRITGLWQFGWLAILRRTGNVCIRQFYRTMIRSAFLYKQNNNTITKVLQQSMACNDNYNSATVSVSAGWWRHIIAIYQYQEWPWITSCTAADRLCSIHFSVIESYHIILYQSGPAGLGWLNVSMHRRSLWMQ